MSVRKQESIHINKFNTNQSLIGPGHYNTLSVPIPNGLNLRDCEVALSELNVYNSIYNVSSALSNNKITVIYLLNPTNINGFVFTVPDGLYQIADLNTWLQGQLIAAGLYSTVSSVQTTFISFAYNPISLKVQVTGANFLDTGATVTATAAFGPAFGGGIFNFSGTPSLFFGSATGITPPPTTLNTPVTPTGVTNAGLDTLLGQANNTFTPTTLTNIAGNTYIPLTAGTTPLSFIPQDTPYNTVLVTCNLVNSTLMPQYNRVIYDYAPGTVAAGTQLSFSPYPDFFDCQDGYYNNITVTFVDENESLVPINDPTMSVTLLIRPKKIADAPQEIDLGSNRRLGAELIAPPNLDDVRLEHVAPNGPRKRTRFA